VKDSLELFDTNCFKRETVPIHGILKQGKEENNRDRRNNTIFDFIKDAVLVGHHVSFDVKMINEGLKRMGLGNSK
jgi:DNA polymerase-3 subunit epsilon